MTKQALAVFVAVSYLGLAILGAACLFGVALVGDAAHHHHPGSVGKTSHSSLCAWVCQVGPATINAGADGPGSAVGTFIWLLLLEAGLLAGAHWSAARPRSPPVYLRVSI
jgi:hypothetical protein